MDIKAENKKLRELLWLNHGHTKYLYGDDGEIQCSKCGLDFKRHDIGIIAKRFSDMIFQRMLEFQKRQEEMSKKYFKTVLLPIKVSFGDFCWDREGRICDYFNNEGGHSRCGLNLCPLKEDKEGRVLKPIECKDLKEVD